MARMVLSLREPFPFETHHSHTHTLSLSLSLSFSVVHFTRPRIHTQTHVHTARNKLFGMRLRHMAFTSNLHLAPCTYPSLSPTHPLPLLVYIFLLFYPLRRFATFGLSGLQKLISQRFTNKRSAARLLFLP